jgi:hypothetical protein
MIMHPLNPNLVGRDSVEPPGFGVPTSAGPDSAFRDPHSTFNCRLTKRQLNSDLIKLRHRMIRRARARARYARWFMRRCQEHGVPPSGGSRKNECGSRSHNASAPPQAV